jgi:hypothetical protein
VSLLRDPEVQTVLQQCRADPTKVRRYLSDPAVASKLRRMQQAGLIQLF